MKLNAEYYKGQLILKPEPVHFHWEIHTPIDTESKFWTVFECPACGGRPEEMRKFTTMELAVNYAIDTIK